MFGFTYIEGDTLRYDFNSIEHHGKIEESEFMAFNHLGEKFVDDKLFINTDDYFLCLDGVILNKRQILQENDSTDWGGVVISRYKQFGDRFFDVFRGTFSGILRDKKKKKTIVISDHIGSRFLYYYDNGGLFIVSSLFRVVLDFLKSNSISYSLSHDSACMLLTYGFMLENHTLCQEVHKINAGCYLTRVDGKVSEIDYCRISNKPKDLSIDDAVDLFDDVFRKAVRLEFEKDQEYGYKHLVDLSGGLDSRMVSVVAHDLGFERQLNLTFSQTDYWDEKIAKKIAEDYKHDWVFKALDGGWWLENFERVNELTGGNVLYYGTAHGMSLFDLLDVSDYGISHTGQLGDVVMRRTYLRCHEREIRPYRIGDGAFSQTLLDQIKHIYNRRGFENAEIGMLYDRGFNGILSSHPLRYMKLETFSPFLNIDVIKTGLSLPIIFGDKNRIYVEWLKRKYPQAASYGWEALKGKTFEEIKSLRYRIRRKVFHLIGAYNKKGKNEKNNMNPISFYLKNNQSLREHLFSFLENNIILVDDENLQKYILMLERGNGVEVCEAITLVAAVKRFFS